MVCFSKCCSNYLLGPILTIIQAGVLCKWANDTQHFLLENFDAISGSPFQIYCFALPFSPSSSWLQQHYAAELSNGVRVIRGLAAKWEICSRTVFLSDIPRAISCWDSSIAVGLGSGSIVILNAITGSQGAILSEHTDEVRSVAFSSDGVSIVSGSNDKTVKVWDVQTGGVIKTFYGHKYWISSVSISTDSIMIASGDEYGMIYLWDIERCEHHCVIEQQWAVSQVKFSPTNPKCLMSISDSKVWQWDTDGHKTAPTYDGSHIAFSPDGTQCVLCNGNVVTLKCFETGATVAKSHTLNAYAKHCCFSPDGRLVVVATHDTIYAWDTTSTSSYSLEPLIRQAGITFDLAFSSPFTLVSASLDNSVRFWQVGVPLVDPDISAQGSTLLTPPEIYSISLKPSDGLVISSDVDGVVKTWDILSGLCKASFQTPAGDNLRDVQLIDGDLILVWHESDKIYIWNTKKAKLLKTVEVAQCYSLRISGDGSKIFCQTTFATIKAWEIQTGMLVGEVGLEGDSIGNFFYLDGSKIWATLKNSSIQGWDFKTSGFFPILLPDIPTERSLLEFFDAPPRIKDKTTGKVVFQLYGRYARPRVAQWDGQYLAAGYETGEVLILDFCHLYPQQQPVVYCLCIPNLYLS